MKTYYFNTQYTILVNSVLNCEQLLLNYQTELRTHIFMVAYRLQEKMLIVVIIAVLYDKL